MTTTARDDASVPPPLPPAPASGATAAAAGGGGGGGGRGGGGGGEEMPGLLERSGYAVSSLSTNAYWQLFMMLQLFFYTDVFGISAAQAGTMFLVTRLWDAVNDPIVGILADKTRTRWGRYRPWLLWASLPFGILGVVAFSTPPLGETGKLVYAYLTYSLLGLAYTSVSIPLSSLIGTASNNSIVRTTLASWNMFGAFVAALCAQLFTLKLVEVLGGGTDLASKQQGFQYTTFLYSSIAVVALLYAFFVMRERVGLKETMKVPLKKQAFELVTNRAWLVLFGVFLMMCLFISIRGASAIYFVKYYLGASGDEVNLFGYTVTEGTAAGIYLALGSVGCLIGTPLMSPLSRRFGKRGVFAGMLAVSAIIAGLHYPLGRDAMLAALVLQTLVGLFSGPLFVLKNAMLADVADQIELEHGHRPTGLIYSAASFSFKFGWTVGGAAAGWVLAWYAFEANVTPSPTTVEGIRLMMSWLPMIPMGLAAALLLLYPLNERRVAANAAALDRRRAAADPV